MRSVVHQVDVTNFYDRDYKDTLVVLGGDAPVWKYCEVAAHCIVEGAAVITIAYGKNPAKDGDSIIAYSTEVDYPVGETYGNALNAIRERDRQAFLADPVAMAKKKRQWEINNAFVEMSKERASVLAEYNASEQSILAMKSSVATVEKEIAKIFSYPDGAELLQKLLNGYNTRLQQLDITNR